MNRTSLSFRATWRTRSRSLDTPSPALRPGRVSLAAFPSGRPLPPPSPPPAPRACSTASPVIRACLTSRDRSSRDYRLSVPLASRHPPTCHPANHPGRGIIDQRGRPPDLPVLSMRRSHTCTGSQTPQGPSTTRDNATDGAAFHGRDRVGAPEKAISRLNSRPACTPVNASLRPHGSPTHHSEPS